MRDAASCSALRQHGRTCFSRKRSCGTHTYQTAQVCTRLNLMLDTGVRTLRNLRMTLLNWMSCATRASNKKQAVTTTQLAFGRLERHRGVEPTEAITNDRLTLAQGLASLGDGGAAEACLQGTPTTPASARFLFYRSPHLLSLQHQNPGSEPSAGRVYYKPTEPDSTESGL